MNNKVFIQVSMKISELEIELSKVSDTTQEEVNEMSESDYNELETDLKKELYNDYKGLFSGLYASILANGCKYLVSGEQYSINPEDKDWYLDVIEVL